jgi:hypothetical protein
MVRDMPVDEFNSTAITEELPPLLTSESGRFLSNPGAISGRARPVVMSDSELAILGEADDPTALPESPATPPPPPNGWSPEPPHSAPLPGREHTSLALIIAIDAVGVIVVMLIVAFGIALAAR